jgi:hypothetical protein
MNSHLWWVHADYSPQLVERWTCVSSPLLSHTPHRRRTGGSRGATQRGVRFDLGGISQLTLWRQGWTLVCLLFVIYFVRLPLCNKYSDYIVTFISIHSVIICVVFFGAYMRYTRLCSLNPGVTMGLKHTWCYHTVVTQSMWSEISWISNWEEQIVLYNKRVHYFTRFPLEDVYSQYCMGGWLLS